MANDKKKSRIVKILVPVLLGLVLVALTVVGGVLLSGDGSGLKSLLSGSDAIFKDGRYDPGKLSVFYLDVGQADGTLICCPDGNCMLIDAGKDENETRLISTLRSCGVERLKYLVLTHPHDDHLGGADAVLETFPVETVIYPAVGADAR